MTRFRLAAVAAVILGAGGCAAPSPGVNYGHPALNAHMAARQAALQPQPRVPPADGAGIAFGALAGGLVGSRLGQGDGRVVSAGVGAATGAMLAQSGGYDPSMAGGALIGGIAGSAFGQGSGQVAATIIGTGLGAYLAVPKQ